MRELPRLIGLASLGIGLACTPAEDDPFASLTANPTAFTLTNTTTNTNTSQETTGDGDDGDGDPATGDGDPTTGDGDPTTGDGDPTTGDGDPTTTGDGDGDPSLPPNCGWNAGGDPPGYYCGFMGEDPSGVEPIACPGGLMAMAPCGTLTGVGCCDQNGDNWYCADDGMGMTFQFMEDCP